MYMDGLEIAMTLAWRARRQLVGVKLMSSGLWLGDKGLYLLSHLADV